MCRPLEDTLNNYNEDDNSNHFNDSRVTITTTKSMTTAPTITTTTYMSRLFSVTFELTSVRFFIRNKIFC